MLDEFQQWLASELPKGSPSDDCVVSGRITENLVMSVLETIGGGYRDIPSLWSHSSAGGYLHTESVLFRTLLRNTNHPATTFKVLRNHARMIASSTYSHTERARRVVEAFYSDDSTVLSEAIINCEAMLAESKAPGYSGVLTADGWLLGYNRDDYSIVEAGLVAKWRLANGLVS